MRQRRVAVFGSTGSIGTACLDVIRHLGQGFSVSALAAAKSVRRIIAQAREFRPEQVVLTDWDAYQKVKRALGSGTRITWGTAGLLDAAQADIVVMAMSGTQGLLPVLRSLELGQRTCLATKEILVGFGEPVMRLARRYRAEVLPIDSELCAVHQCLAGQQTRSVAKVVLTASGGPFRDRPIPGKARVSQVLNHPTWKMGRKITVDSATLMNKGLEVIETVRLFGLAPSQVEAVIHPQSIVHSLVEYRDGSVMAQLSVPDMRLPLQYCLTYPNRAPSLVRPLDIARTRELGFHPIDQTKFRCFGLAYQALAMGGAAPCCLNAANQVAVEAFLDGRIAFGTISGIIETTLSEHSRRPALARPGIKHLLAVESWAARFAHSLVNQQRKPVR